MKTLKLFSILALLGLNTMLSQTFAQTDDRVVTVPDILVQGLGNLRGQHVSIFYAVGRPAVVSASNEGRKQVSMREVKLKSTHLITGDEIRFPSVQLQKSEFNMAYNLIVVVVHREQNFVWVNTSGTIPQGENPGGGTVLRNDNVFVDYLLKSEVEDLASSGIVKIKFRN